MLRNLLPSSTDSTAPQRLPTFTALLLAHALHCIYYPSSFLYPLLSRFMLQRPELDKTDVPMLFSMLYSSSDDWKKERGWILRFLSDGMCSTQDWAILKRRHTWDLLASMFQASEDKSVRTSILDVSTYETHPQNIASLPCLLQILVRMTSHDQSNSSLILRSALLPWVEMQISDTRKGEAGSWLRVLDSIVCSANAEKLERATHGSWRTSICHCLSMISTQGLSLKIHRHVLNAH